MSFVLRHKPDEIGLVLDENGWVAVADLVDRSGGRLNQKMVLEIVETNDKKRFSLSDDGLQVRAAQGHSVNIDLGLAASEPPHLLFHGTAERFVDSIKQKGLISGARNHVHLSLDLKTARKVGARHGRPVIISVLAGPMHRDGSQFFLSKNGVWLTDQVPVQYLKFDN